MKHAASNNLDMHVQRVISIPRPSSATVYMSEQDEHEYTCKREHIVIAHELLKEADHLTICIIKL